MSYIGYIDFDIASPDLQRIYKMFGGQNKCPANIIRISGVNPPAMEQHVKLYWALMSVDSPLSRHRQEMIAVVVSALNKCHY